MGVLEPELKRATRTEGVTPKHDKYEAENSQFIIITKPGQSNQVSDKVAASAKVTRFQLSLELQFLAKMEPLFYKLFTHLFRDVFLTQNEQRQREQHRRFKKFYTIFLT